MASHKREYAILNSYPRWCTFRFKRIVAYAYNNGRVYDWFLTIGYWTLRGWAKRPRLF